MNWLCKIFGHKYIWDLHMGSYCIRCMHIPKEQRKLNDLKPPKKKEK